MSTVKFSQIVHNDKFGGVYLEHEKKSANFTTSPNVGYILDVSGGDIEITLNTSPIEDERVSFYTYKGFDNHVAKVNAGSGKRINNSSAPLALDTQRELLEFIYKSGEWKIFENASNLIQGDYNYVKSFTIDTPNVYVFKGQHYNIDGVVYIAKYSGLFQPRFRDDTTRFEIFMGRKGNDNTAHTLRGGEQYYSNSFYIYANNLYFSKKHGAFNTSDVSDTSKFVFITSIA